MSRIPPLLDRAAEELEVGTLLAGSGHHAQAYSRAYYAAIYAAQAALEVVGESRSKHAGVLAAFTRFIVQGGGLPEQHGASLRKLFRGRVQADYELVTVPEDVARRAISDAASIVDGVREWIAGRGRLD